jgi:hypothetical protein
MKMADSIESTKGKHTPGPWRLVRLASQMDSRLAAFGIAYGPAGNRLAIVDGEGNASLSNAANARLIAEAPAMLEALRQIARFDNHAITGPGRIQADAMADIARAILARIDGEG